MRVVWVRRILATYLISGSAFVYANDADRVLIVRNGGSPVSKAIADDYVYRRGLRHVLTIYCKDSSVADGEVPSTDWIRRSLGTKAETIDISSFQREIEAPLRAYLATHSGIDFIVLTKGIPIRIEGAGGPIGIDRYSLDSRIAALGYDRLPGAVKVEVADPNYEALSLQYTKRHFQGYAWANRFWNSEERFSHAKYGGYLVTRLDGYTEADAKALVLRSLLAQQVADAGKTPSGAVLLDVAPEQGFTEKAKQPYSILSEPKAGNGEVRIVDEGAHLGDFNSSMQLAADILKSRGIPVELDESARFVGQRSGLMGYVSWGSNDSHFEESAYHSLRFAPGSISETAVSSSGRTFLVTQGGQTLAADLIAQGISGIKGYVSEPLVQAIAAPNIMFDRYTRGWTLAESLYAASALVGWQDVVIGDPLCRAYPVR